MPWLRRVGGLVVVVVVVEVVVVDGVENAEMIVEMIAVHHDKTWESW